MIDGVWPWGEPGSELVLTHALEWQYLSGLLIGLGVGGVVGASTLGVAMFSLVAPAGSLREFTAIVPIINVMANFASISVYVKHANWALCFRMWPYILAGIAAGALLLPLLAESQLRRMTSLVYGGVLAQQLYDKYSEYRAARTLVKGNTGTDDGAMRRRRAAFYTQTWVMALVSLVCGMVTVITNNSGPIFNIYVRAPPASARARPPTQLLLRARSCWRAG
jgi:uncharacterized membrane protein YfcA